MNLLTSNHIQLQTLTMEHYQKIYEYKQNYRRKKYIGILGWYLLSELIPSPDPSVFTNKNISLVNTKGILV